MADKPKRIRVDVRSNTRFEEQPGGNVRAYFAPLDVAGVGATEEEAFDVLRAELGSVLETSEEARNVWKDYVAEYGIEEDVPEEEIRERNDVIERSHAASEGFAVLDDESLDRTIASDGPVLVDFWAEWCMPCHMIAPTLREVADHLGDRLTVAKINVDDHKDMWERFGIRGIPTMILFRGGTELHRIVGAGRSKQQLLDELEPHLR